MSHSGESALIERETFIGDYKMNKQQAKQLLSHRYNTEGRGEPKGFGDTSMGRFLGDQAVKNIWYKPVRITLDTIIIDEVMTALVRPKKETLAKLKAELKYAEDTRAPKKVIGSIKGRLTTYINNLQELTVEAKQFLELLYGVDYISTLKYARKVRKVKPKFNTKRYSNASNFEPKLNTNFFGFKALKALLVESLAMQELEVENYTKVGLTKDISERYPDLTILLEHLDSGEAPEVKAFDFYGDKYEEK